MQLTKDYIEQILQVGYIAEDEIDFVRSLLPDIESDSTRPDLEEYLDSLVY